MDRRTWFKAAAGTAAFSAGIGIEDSPIAHAAKAANGPLTIRKVVITPIALPDPPLLAAGGCHGPYFLRNIVEVHTDGGIIGIGETRGGSRRLAELTQAVDRVVGMNAFAIREIAGRLEDLDGDVYAGIELACLDACGRATGRRVCELLGGPVRESVEFAAYLFYRFAADHPVLLKDPRIVDGRGKGDQALDQWGEVTTPESMTEMAKRFREKWGFRVLKLKAGVFAPDLELETMRMMNSEFDGKCPLRIDPNARWTSPTAVAAAPILEKVNLEYYEDPVQGQDAMAAVRRRTGFTMSTNMCVTRFHHIADAVRKEPIDVVLGDHHGWGGIPAFIELGRICEVFGWGLSQHSNNHAGITMAAMIHAGATAPQLNYASDTHYVWLVEGADIIQGPNLKIENGFMKVPPGPGLGVELDRDKLAAAHETYVKCGMTDRDDGATMRMVQPNWDRTLY